MQEFKSIAATIIAARERSMKNSNGDYVAKVIISLDNGEDVFAPLSTLNNTIDKVIVKSDLTMLQGSTLHYIASDVKAGDEFSFVKGGDIAPEPANVDLHITTLKAVMPTKRLRKHLEQCASYVQPNDGNAPANAPANEPDTKTTSEELLAELVSINNVSNMRAFVQDNDIFDEYVTDFAEFTTAEQYRLALTTILESNPI